MSMMNNTASPIYSKEMLEPFLKPFLEVEKRVREEYTKYGNNLDDYIKRKTEETQKELLELLFHRICPIRIK